MKIVIAPDSFKGSLSAPDAAAAIAAGWKRVFSRADCVLLPVADGGEGTRQALVTATHGSNCSCMVTDALGKKRLAAFGRLGDGTTAVVELADVAGLTRVPPRLRDPKITTTRGVGELILAALSAGGTRLILGLGGSATNDGGSGLLSALGICLRDDAGNPLPDGGAALSRLATVDRSTLKIDPTYRDVWIACDVDNPLTGPRGASAIFGPQKGASPEDIALLDVALAHYACVLGMDPTVPGSGAAGGAAAGLLYLFPQARLVPGIDLVLDAIGFDRHLAGADLVITGEGRLDGQTLGGKAVAGVAKRAAARGIPVLALVGGIGEDVHLPMLAQATGVDAVLPVVPGPVTLKAAMKNAARFTADAAERAARLIQLSRISRERVFPEGQDSACRVNNLSLS